MIQFDLLFDARRVVTKHGIHRYGERAYEIHVFFVKDTTWWYFSLLNLTGQSTFNHYRPVLIRP